MKRFGTAVAVAVTILALAGCNDYGNTFQVPTGASISSLSPADIPAQSPQFTLTVNGFGFVAKTVVQWNEKTIPTQVQTDSSGNVTGITATVAASLVATPGIAYVQTLSPHSGAGTNGLSNTLAFIIDPAANPTPSITSISPASSAAGGGSFALTINGQNFIPASNPSSCTMTPNANSCGSHVNWNMGATQTTFNMATSGANMSVSSSTITLTIPASLVASTGCAVVTVYNPPSDSSSSGSGSGGGTSNGENFVVGNASCPSAAKASESAQAVAEETPAVSSDGRYVAYTAEQEGHFQIFVRDTCEGAASGCRPRTTLLSTATDGVAGNADSHTPSMSADGRYVGFSSAATNLVSDAPVGRQIYLRDTCSGATTACAPSTQLISLDPNGALVGAAAILPSVSASGRFVAFLAVTPSHAKTDLSSQLKLRGSTANSGYRQVFVRDTCLGAASCTPKTSRISLAPGDTSTTDGKPAGPAISGTAKHVALPDASMSTLFTSGVAVDDRVFLAFTEKQQ
jgi:IPT/TIG domain-containing protein/WD40 repeat protein